MSDGFVTVGQCVEGLPIGRLVWEALLCAFLAWFLLGAINDSAPFSFSLIHTEWPNSESNVMAMSAALVGGNFVAIAIGGWIADTYGRLTVVLKAMVCTIAAGLMLQLANGLPQALIARFTLGLVSGGLLSVLPTLIAELLPSRHRGFYLTVWSCGWPAGALFSVFLATAFPGIGWRELYTLVLSVALFLYAGIHLDMLPESARFLYMAGRREEGYDTLLDMYDKEQMPMPWAPESISTGCASATSTTSIWQPPLSTLGWDENKRKKVSWRSVQVILWLAVTMFLANAAAQSVKLWMPTMLMAHNADQGVSLHSNDHRDDVVDMSELLDFATGPKALSLLRVVSAPLMFAHVDYGAVHILVQAYVVQIAGVIGFAWLSAYVPRKELVRWPLLAAAALTMLGLVAATGRYQAMLCGPLLGAQLAAQATAINFLQVFAIEFFPTSRRALMVSLATFAGQLGSFIVPVIGGVLVRGKSAAIAIMFFASLYLVAWCCSFRLPLPTGSERPLHDVDEATRAAASSAKKRAWADSYHAAA